MILFKLLGALGLILITAGVLLKNKKHESIVFILGGISLEAYSIYIRDYIFIVLQLVFVLAAVYELYKIKKR